MKNPLLKRDLSASMSLSDGLLHILDKPGWFFPGPIRSLFLRLVFLVVFSAGFSHLFSPAPSLAQDLNPDLLKDDPKLPWHIEADFVEYDNKARVYLARGNVSISKKDRKIMCDFIRFDHRNLYVEAKGDVTMAAGGDMLTGSRMEMDLAKETGVVYDGTVFLQENHFYISGSKILKTGKNTYAAEKASVTTCDGKSPDWKITGRKIKVTIEGYGRVDHAAFWAKKAPLLYSPIMVFPVKLKRQTGLLPPEIGYSDRRGLEYFQPFYQTLGESADATFTLHHMGYRGEKIGTELRYMLSEQDFGVAMLDFLDDKKIDDSKPGRDSTWGYTDKYPRTNSDRYWFRMKHDHMLGNDIRARLDLDVVSDQDFLDEFKTGPSGYDDSDGVFEDWFSRGLDPYEDSVRINRLELTKQWGKYWLNAEARYYDNVLARRFSDEDDTLHKMPEARMYSAQSPVFSLPVHYDFDVAYTHFYSEDGPTGQRMDAVPRFSMPMGYDPYFRVEPSAVFRQTFWHSKDFGDTQDDIQHREIQHFSLDFSTQVHRVFSGFTGRLKALRHTIRPGIVYDFAPKRDQDAFPDFDARDRVEQQNRVTYSITNTVMGKAMKPAAKDEPEMPFYRQLMWFKLAQSYDINEAQEDDPSLWAAPDEERRPFSSVSGELEISPFDLLRLQADAAWSPYDHTWTERNLAAIVRDGRGDRLYVDHRYEEDVLETLYARLDLKVTDRWSAAFDYEKNLKDGEQIRSSVGVLYHSQCWSVDVRYTDEEDDQAVSFKLNLYGLGEIKNQL